MRARGVVAVASQMRVRVRQLRDDRVQRQDGETEPGRNAKVPRVHFRRVAKTRPLVN